MVEGSRLSKKSLAHPFGPVLARSDAESLRTAQAVTSFLRTVYNVLSTRVASFLAFRCIINEQLALAPWLTPLTTSPFPSHEPKRDVPPPVIASLLFPRDLSLLLLLSLASRAALSSLVCRLSFEAYNEMRKRDGGIHRWPNRGDSLTKGNPICTWGDGGRRPPSQRALVFHGNSFVT